MNEGLSDLEQRVAQLTESEKSVLCMIAQGKGYDAIASDLSYHRSHISRIAGNAYHKLGSQHMAMVAAFFYLGATPPATLAEVKGLSGRPREVFLSMGEGLTSQDISGKLGISINTVKSSLHNLGKYFDLSGDDVRLVAICHYASNLSKAALQQVEA